MNPVVHFEMPYTDEKRMKSFYETVFGWKMKSLGEEMMNYVLAKTSQPIEKRDAIMKDSGRGAVDGGFFPQKSGSEALSPSIVIGVPDIQEAIQQINKHGGEVLGEPMMIPGTGEYVSFLDTEGNRASVLQPLPME